MLAIVLGSGLGRFADYFENVKNESFGNLLNLHFDPLDGHERKFVWCRYGEEIFLVLSGKFHFYEGHSYDDLIVPIKYAIDAFGVREIIVTSASGSLSEENINGEWTYINRVVSVPNVNLAISRKINTYVRKRNIRIECSTFSFMPCVTYAYHQGPSLGTNAEYRMLHYLGAHLVGMSMYPEYCYLKTLDIKSHFLSIPVCNYYPFDNTEEPDFDEVLDISSSAIPKLVDIFKQYLLSSKS